MTFLPDEDAIDEANEPLLKMLKAALPTLEPLLQKAKNSGQLEAFFHARTFFEATARSAKTLEHAPVWMSSEWATVLYLYQAR